MMMLLLTQSCSKKMAAQTNKTNVFVNSKDTLSYAIGTLIGGSLKSGGIKELNEKIFMNALNDQLTGAKSIFDSKMADSIVRAFVTKEQKLLGQGNIEKGKKFLEENAKKPGVIVLPSGLQYKIIKEGTGERPQASDKVTVNYHGTLIDSTVFDSSVDRGEPIQVSVGNVIKGWTEALQMMKVGSKWTLYIPSDLAYGERAMGKIAANSVLIFEVELISIDNN